MLPVGEEFEGYVVDTTLGRGGYATVYRVHTSAEPNHAVALKVLDHHHRNEDQTTRLRREFEFAHQLDHPHVITVHQHGVGWLTMELVDGGTATVLTERKDQLSALAQIADALDYIHQCGIVHCDVKPSNILVSQGLSRAVLIDFGVAHTVAETVWRRPAQLEASLPYTAPELLRGRPPSALTDQYALACTAVELLLGAPPFSGRHGHGVDGRTPHPAGTELLAQDRLGTTHFRLGAAQGVGEDPGEQVRLMHGVGRAPQ